jgi:hypothetical protein
LTRVGKSGLDGSSARWLEAALTAYKDAGRGHERPEMVAAMTACTICPGIDPPNPLK